MGNLKLSRECVACVVGSERPVPMAKRTPNAGALTQLHLERNTRGSESVHLGRKEGLSNCYMYARFIWLEKPTQYTAIASPA